MGTLMTPKYFPLLRQRCALVLLLLGVATTAFAQRQMERLGRGVVALHSATSQAYIGWRLLATDPTDIGFNLYRSANGAAGVKLNASPITNTTDFLDTNANFTIPNAWYVVTVTNGVEGVASAAASLAANSLTRQYLSWPLVAVTNGGAPPYDVKFCWVGDFDGDGEYDYLVDRLSTTVATNQFLQAYKRDGTFLWQMDMGYNSTNQYNIEPGASAISVGHGDCVTVYDLDGDGKAEVIVRTARGVILPNGTTISGPDDTTQYLSILNGLTGAEMARATITNMWPADGPMNGHFGIMYCDGVRPSVVLHMENRNAAQNFQRETMAYDFRNGQLTRRWFETPAPGANESWGHQIRIMDVNHDGIDDLLNVGSALSGVNGQPLFDTELIHGDRFHVTDIDPDRPGLEMFSIQQNNSTLLATALIDVGNGSIIKKWYASGVVDVGRGTTFEMTPDSRGLEFYSTQPGIFDCKGNQLYANSIWPPEAIWWDADLSRELEDGAGSGALSPVINKFDPVGGGAGRMYSIYTEGVHQQYGGRAAFWGDILGDWREEVVLVANDYSELRVYTTKLTATNRLYCLMQNPAYRDQATCKGYYQASYVDYFLGNGMPAPAPAPISDAKLVWRGDGVNVWDANSTANWRTNWFYIGNANTNPAPFTPGDSVLFDISGSNNTAITLSGSLAPSDVRVHAPKNFTFSGSGELTGAMGLTKAGAGKLIFNGTNTYAGKTLIAEGSFVVNGSLPSSAVTVRGGVWLDGRLGGNGVVGGAVSLQEGAGFSPGQGTNSPGILTVANNVTLTGRTMNDFDLSDDASGAAKTNDLVNITGNLTLLGTNTLVIRRLNATLPPGSVYPLINYSGTLTGGLANLLVTGVSGIPVALTNPPGQIALVVKSCRAPATVIWTGGLGGNAWDLLTSSNWLNGVAKDQFAPFDTARFDNTGSSNLTVNLTGDLNCSNVVVDSSANYVLAGSGAIIGAASLTKTNSGTLTISALNNSFTGKTILAGGTLVVSELDAIGFPSPLGNPPGGSTNLVLSGSGTLRITGESYTDRGLTLNSGTNTLEVANAADQVTIADRIIGTGALLKAGPGALALTVSNGYSGGTFVYGGSISLGSVAGNQYGLGSGVVTISNATINLIDLQASETCAWSIRVPTNATATINCDGRSVMSGALTGGGTLNVFSPYVRTDFSGNWSAFTGQINATGGNFRENNSAGYPLAKLYVGNASLQNRVGGTPTISIGELSGALGGNASAGGGNDGLPVNWSVGGLNTSATFSGNTYNGIGFIKVGTGTWTWNGTNLAHTGPTTVNGGTLLYHCNGTNATGAVTVGAAGTLGGNGVVGGPATVNGRVAPGTGIGVLTFSNNLTFNASGGAVMEISKSPFTNDLARVRTTVSFGGTLIVTNVGGGTLGAGDSFKLFDATTFAGSFVNYLLPTLNVGLAWNTTSLISSGTLSVVVQTNVALPAAPSGLIATAASSSQINLTWTDNSTNENNFLVERSPDNTNFTQIISVNAGVTNVSDPGLAAATLYYYRVRANNGGGNSAYSSTASATTLPAPTGLVWRGDGVTNIWDIGGSSNWLAGVSRVVFANGAAVTFDDSGSNNIPVNLTSSLSPASITLNATKNYTFGGTGFIAGTNSLTKLGTATLTLTTPHTFTGDTLINGGSLKVVGLGAGLTHRWSFNNSLADSIGGLTASIVDVGANNVTLGANSIQLAGGTRTTTDYVNLGSELLPNTTAPVTIELWATQNAIQNWGRIFDFGSATAENLMMSWTVGTTLASDRVEWVDAAQTSTVDNSNQPYALGVEFHIAMVIEPGAGAGGTTRVTWYRAATTNSAMGTARGTFNSTNTLVNFADSNCWLGRSEWTADNTASASYNEVRIWNRALSATDLQLLHEAGPDASTNASLPALTAVALNDATARLENASGHALIIGSLAGVGGSEVRLTGGALVTGGDNSSTTFAGFLSGTNGLTKQGSGTLILSGSNTHSGLMTINSGTLQIGENGTGGTLGANNVSNQAALVFNRADTITDSGVISGSGSLTQIGDGVLILTNSHSYFGPTLIQSGTLAIAGNGAIANSTNVMLSEGALLDVSSHAGGNVTLASGQTLSGNGNVRGNLIFASGAKLSPGNSVGTLTFSNALTLAAGSSTQLEISKGPLANDALTVLGTFTYGGNLVVTNVSGNALAGGDSFVLWNAATHSGAFASLLLPPLGTNLVWDTNAFLASGTLAVVSTAPPMFGNMTSLVDGNFRLSFSGPAGRDYELRATTNLALTPVTLWDLVASGTFSNGAVTFDDSNATNFPQRYYRLVVP